MGDGVPAEAVGDTGSVVGLVVYVSIALGFSFVCSVLEAVLLSTSRSYLEVQIQNGSRAARRMRRHKQEIDRSISAILTLNTIAHTLGAAGAGAEAAEVFGSQWIGLIGAVLTILILVVSEIIPKTLGAVFWRPLNPISAHTISVLVVTLYPVVWACQVITDLLKPKTKAPTITRAELEILAQLGGAEGTLKERELRVFENLLNLDRVQVKDILTPRTVLFALPADRTAREVRESGELAFSRVPIYEEDLDDIQRFVLRIDIVDAVARGEGDTPLEKLSRPLPSVPANITVGAVLAEFIEKQAHIFLVVDEYGGTAGIVTLEDAIESLLGAEITDESDFVENMRELARQRAQRRRRIPPPEPQG
jgi:CBS domain containing-hemolysin-like protein